MKKKTKAKKPRQNLKPARLAINDIADAAMRHDVHSLVAAMLAISSAAYFISGNSYSEWMEIADTAWSFAEEKGN